MVEQWSQFDSLGLLTQIGVMPPPGAGPGRFLATVGATIGRGIAATIRQKRQRRA